MPLPRSVLLPFLVGLLSASAPPPCRATAHSNITAILLSGRGDLAAFSRALAATGLADRITNSRDDAVTVLAVADANMAPLGASASGGLPREALSRHVLAGYYDDARLRRLLPGLGGAANIVAPTLEDPPAGSAAGAVKITRERRSGRVAFVPLHDARATVFYVRTVHVDASGSVSVLLVSGVMWNPAAAPPVPELKPSTAPPGHGPSRAGVPRVVSPDAVMLMSTQFKAPSDDAPMGSAISSPLGDRVASAPQPAAMDDARAAEVPGHQTTPHHASATQELGVSSSTTPAPAPPVDIGARGSQKISGWFIFDIFAVALFLMGLICCCRCGN